MNSKLIKFCLRNYNCSKRATGNTIFSLSSGKGKCGVSVIRVSGPQTSTALHAMIQNATKITDRFAHLKNIYHPISKDIIDKGLVLWFPKPQSFTGEDVCEFHVHGSLAVVSSILNALSMMEGLRSAEPGEFTKRAYLNAKIDLTQAEGIADLIHAETEMQRKQAFLQCDGVLSKLFNNWRKRLVKCLSYLEAYIDFSEEEHIGDNMLKQIIEELHLLNNEISTFVNDARKGELMRHGIKTIILGAPNVGKSTLINLISRRRVSIVSPYPGTTRDVIESVQDIGGYPVIFQDTAGLRESSEDPIEMEGIKLTKKSFESSNLILIILDGSQLNKESFISNISLRHHIECRLRDLNLEPLSKGQKIKIIVNKIDLLDNNEIQSLKNIPELQLISCKSERNINEFLSSLHNCLKEMYDEPRMENPRLTNDRHRKHLEECRDIIALFLNTYGTFNSDMAITALHLRSAVKCLERITGHVSANEILDVIFKDFCIGK